MESSLRGSKTRQQKQCTTCQLMLANSMATVLPQGRVLHQGLVGATPSAQTTAPGPCARAKIWGKTMHTAMAWLLHKTRAQPYSTQPCRAHKTLQRIPGRRRSALPNNTMSTAMAMLLHDSCAQPYMKKGLPYVNFQQASAVLMLWIVNFMIWTLLWDPCQRDMTG